MDLVTDQWNLNDNNNEEKDNEREKEATIDIENSDKQRKEEERREGEWERAETGLDSWVDHEEPLGEKTPDEILLDNTVPVLQQTPRLMWKPKMTQDKKKDKKEELTKEQKTDKKTPRAKLVVKEPHRIEGTKYYCPWVTGIQEERKRNWEGRRDLLGNPPELPKLFSELDQINKQTERGTGTKDKKRLTLKNLKT